MNFPFYIARRYLFSKKSTNAINVISGISVLGVAVATMALVVTLSVFNGFSDLVATFFTAFDPQIKVVPIEGKTAPADDPILTEIKSMPEVYVATECVEDQALAVYNGRQAMIHLKGVEDNFDSLTHIRSILQGDGTYELHVADLHYGIPGRHLIDALGMGYYYPMPLKIYAPRREGQLDMSDPTEGFIEDELYSPGVVFEVQQSKYDRNYILTSISFARRLFDQQGMMKIEKLIAYIFLTFILMVACFNIIGSLSMLIIDKKDDVVTLRNLGASDKQITQIFLFEGRLISAIGAIFGIAVGLLLCWIQQTYGVISLGSSEGSFVINAYPVSVHPWDVIIVFLTVMAVGFLSVWYPVHYFSRRLLA